MFGGGRGPLGGGGGMLRAAGRAMTRTGVTNGGIQDPFSSSPSSPVANASVSHGGRPRKLGSSSSGSNNLTISAASGFPNMPVPATFGWSGYEDFEWVSEDGCEEDEDSVFGSVPSVDEVQDAVSALQQVFDDSSYSSLVRDRYTSYPEDGGGSQSPIVATGMVHQAPPSFRSDLDWMEPSVSHSRVLTPHAYDQVYSAFDLLRTEPSIQRMVISLSSDKSVWEAVMNNEVVQEIKELYNKGTTSQDEESSDDTRRENNAAMDFIRWVFDNTMVKATEVFEKITKAVAELFNTHNGHGVNDKGRDAEFNDWLEEKLRTSVLLSFVVLLVVMVSRTCNRP